MARVEMTRQFPVRLQQAWDYMNDPHHWREWFANLLSVDEPEPQWGSPGDTVRFTYRLLGREVRGECAIDRREAPTMISYTARIPGLPSVHHEWRHTDLGEAISTVVVLEAEEPTSLFGKVVDRLLLPRVLERDLRRTLENLEDLFAMGVPS
jgi:hypothetical protein